MKLKRLAISGKLNVTRVVLLIIYNSFERYTRSKFTIFQPRIFISVTVVRIDLLFFVLVGGTVVLATGEIINKYFYALTEPLLQITITVIAVLTASNLSIDVVTLSVKVSLIFSNDDYRDLIRIVVFRSVLGFSHGVI